MRSEIAFDLAGAVMATADAFLRESQRLFRPHGITGAQYNVLNILASRAAGLSQRELGDLLVVDRSNVTGLLDRLEKLGWVHREDHPEDRRVYQVLLTATGRAKWREVHPVYLKAVAKITDSLSERQMRAALDVLSKLQAGTGELNAAPAVE